MPPNMYLIKPLVLFLVCTSVRSCVAAVWNIQTLTLWVAQSTSQGGTESEEQRQMLFLTEHTIYLVRPVQIILQGIFMDAQKKRSGFHSWDSLLLDEMSLAPTWLVRKKWGIRCKTSTVYEVINTKMLNSSWLSL